MLTIDKTVIGRRGSGVLPGIVIGFGISGLSGISSPI